MNILDWPKQASQGKILQLICLRFLRLTPVVNVMKQILNIVGMFAHGEPFQPSLIFWARSGALP
jgi:hypothetical protein